MQSELARKNLWRHSPACNSHCLAVPFANHILAHLSWDVALDEINVYQCELPNQEREVWSCKWGGQNYWSQRDAPCNQELELFHGGAHVQARAHACWRPVRAHIAKSLVTFWEAILPGPSSAFRFASVTNGFQFWPSEMGMDPLHFYGRNIKAWVRLHQRRAFQKTYCFFPLKHLLRPSWRILHGLPMTST